MEKFPKISIITPVYNRYKYLEETILSVINQGYPNLEYIIIDGGSNDGTIDIIKKYESMLSYWISEPDDGMYFALQKGFAKSTGDIMAWINSDDKYIDKSLYAIARIFMDLSDIEWIIGMPTLLDEDGVCVKTTHGRRWSESRFYAGDYRWVQQESVFWKRSLWEKAGGMLNRSFKYASDLELWCRFFQYAQLYSVSCSFAGFRSHGDQISINHLNDYEKEANDIIKAIMPRIEYSNRYNNIRRIWKWRDTIADINSMFTKYASIILTWFVDKLHRYPSQIYFDLADKKWKN